MQYLFSISLDTAETAVPPKVTGSLMNIAPPSALPSFITGSVIASATSLSNQSQELIKTESAKSSMQLPDGITTSQPTASTSTDNMPQVLIAPDSPTMDSGALAGSLFTWVKDTVANSNVLSKVAEKAKNSVNSMITTLDPQMREFICK